jgi:putative sporulation protein YyaC
VNYTEEDAIVCLGEELKSIIDDKTIVVTIGTDKIIGDSLGPLVGSLLVDSGIDIPVFGNLDNPIHGENYEYMIQVIRSKYPEHKIITIEGCLGNEGGNILIKNGNMHPGLAGIGDVCIKAVVASRKHASNFAKLQIRLRYIMGMAVVIRNAFIYATKSDIRTNETINKVKSQVQSLKLHINEIESVLNQGEEFIMAENKCCVFNTQHESENEVSNYTEEKNNCSNKRTTLTHTETKAERLNKRVLSLLKL